VLNMVTLTGTFTNGSGAALTGTLAFAPSVPLVDMTDAGVVLPALVTVDLNSLGQFSAGLYATDNADLQPPGWTWGVTQNIGGLPQETWSFFLAWSLGATQDISALTPVATAVPAVAYLPESGGTMTGTAILGGSPPLNVPGAAYGDTLVSDAYGNFTPGAGLASVLTLTDSAGDMFALQVSSAGALSTQPVMQDQSGLPITDQGGELMF
jgi:hypothetical protein